MSRTLPAEPGTTARILTVAYGAVSYLIAFGSIVYAIGFVGGFGVPKTLDSGPPVGVGAALATDLALLAAFALQHSVMARPGFKARWTKVVPSALERPTYVLCSGLALWLMFALWAPLPAVVWSTGSEALRLGIGVVYGAGWAIMLLATFMIDHLDLFGLRQVWLHDRGRSAAESRFVVRGFYRVVRHPIQLGLLIAFWATPTMTAGHLVFSVMTTLYIVVALQFEERDLVAEFGEAYRTYRRQVFMFLPLRRYRAA